MQCETVPFLIKFYVPFSWNYVSGLEELIHLEKEETGVVL
jgi:hypothetical protein